MSSLVLVSNSTRVGGLVRLEYHATNPVVRGILAKLGALNSTWDSKLKPIVQADASKAAGRQVILLNGNFVKQSKGVVSYHGANPLLGKYIEGGRKGYNATTGVFHMWAVIK